jgi:hypothetical protein
VGGLLVLVRRLPPGLPPPRPIGDEQHVRLLCAPVRGLRLPHGLREHDERVHRHALRVQHPGRVLGVQQHRELDGRDLLLRGHELPRVHSGAGGRRRRVWRVDE